MHKLPQPLFAVVRVLILVCMLGACVLTIARWEGYRVLSVQSDSMRPVMRRGDAVLVRSGEADLRVGAIISYTSPHNPKLVITHRILHVNTHSGILTTKGDNSSSMEVIPAWNVIGQVQGSVPLAGLAIDMVRHPLGLLLAIYAPAIILVVGEVRQLARYYAGGLPHYYVRYRWHYK